MSKKKKNKTGGLVSPLDDVSWKSIEQELEASLYDEPPPEPGPPKPGWLVGYDEHGKGLVIPYDEIFQTHVHVLGTSGFGKTFLLYQIACQCILHGNGVVLIDPDSQLYWMLVNFLVQRKVDPERVILINPLRDEFTLKMNPLESWDGVMGMGTDFASGALLRAKGEDDFRNMPRLERFMKGALMPMEQARMPLALLAWFCDTSPRGNLFRQLVTTAADDHYPKLLWAGFQQLTKAAKELQLESTINRAFSFAEDPRVRQMVTYAEGNIDWKKVANQGKIVLCNLGQRGGRSLSKDNRHMIGSTIIHGLVQASHRRSLDETQRIFCICDEFADFVSEDVAEGLDKCRKSKVHFVLAHQRLGQIELQSPNVMEAITDECKIKLVFGGLGRVNAERMVGELFTGEMSGDEIKRSVSNIAFRPITKWVDIEALGLAHSSMSGRSYTIGFAHSTSTSESSGGSRISGSGHGTGMTVTHGPGVFYMQDSPTTYTMTDNFHDTCSVVDNWHQTRAESDTYSSSETESWALTDSVSKVVTRIPMTEYEEFLQPPQIERYTLEESREKKVDLLMNLERRKIVVKLTGKPSRIVTTVAIEEQVVTTAERLAYETEVLTVCPYVVDASEAAQIFDALMHDWGFDDTNLAEPDTFAAAGVAPTLPDQATLSAPKKKKPKTKRPKKK